jgi:hypothetical protein
MDLSNFGSLKFGSLKFRISEISSSATTRKIVLRKAFACQQARRLRGALETQLAQEQVR